MERGFAAPEPAGPVEAPDPLPTPAPSALRSRLLEVQRSAGNRAALALLGESGRDTPDRSHARIDDLVSRAMGETTQPGTGAAPRIGRVHSPKPVVQREWGPPQAGMQRWDVIVGGLDWYQNAGEETFLFFVDDEGEVPAELRELAGTHDGDSHTRDEWANLGFTVPGDPPPAISILPGALLAQVLHAAAQYLTPSEVANTFVVCKSWSGDWHGEEVRDKRLRVAIGQLQLRDPIAMSALTERAKQLAPYRSITQLAVATEFVVDVEEFLGVAWQNYQRASNVDDNDVAAILYSLRAPVEKSYYAASKGTDPANMLMAGAVYGPGDKHNMAVNRVWFLGVLHSDRDIVLITPLTTAALTRGYSKHPELQGGSGASALARELLAATSRKGEVGRFTTPELPQVRDISAEGVPGPALFITQLLKRNPEVSGATLEDITYAEELTASQAEKMLAERGVSVTDQVAATSVQLAVSILRDKILTYVASDVASEGEAAREGLRKLAKHWREEMSTTWGSIENGVDADTAKAIGEAADILFNGRIDTWVDEALGKRKTESTDM